MTAEERLEQMKEIFARTEKAVAAFDVERVQYPSHERYTYKRGAEVVLACWREALKW